MAIMDFDFEYLWEELELSLSTQDMDKLIRLLNLDKVKEAKAMMIPILEDNEELDFLIAEFKKISNRKFDMVSYSIEKAIEDLLNDEITFYVANIFGNVEQIILLNMGNKEEPKIKFLMKNDILDITHIQQLWKPVYQKT